MENEERRRTKNNKQQIKEDIENFRKRNIEEAKVKESSRY
jgi:hypothetical protein